MRKFASAALWVALAAQLIWVLANTLAWHRTPGFDAFGAIILITFTAFAARHQHQEWRWLSPAVRALMAADFLLAVADRFGILGPPGSSGLSWGNFAHFVNYSHSITPFVPYGLAPSIAWLATIAEITLAVALLLGFRLQSAARAAAALLAVYGTAMTVSLPTAEQFHYNVFVLAAGMLTLANVARPPFTVDAVLNQMRSLVPAHGPIPESVS